jgi:choline dehydrogenase-like flavoprotein
MTSPKPAPKAGFSDFIPMPNPRSAIVVGSGPTAAGAVHALLAQGVAVTVLDFGNRLENETGEVIRRMSQSPPDEWDPADLAKITARGESETESVHAKRSYGSNYAFDDRNNAVGVDWEGPKCFNHSLAFGGLTNIWGSSMLPYRAADIADWPVSLSDLVPHYRRIMELVPCTGSRGDDIDEILPGYSEQSNRIDLSKQGQALLDDLQKRRIPLLRGGIRTGKARLAIQASETSDSNGCQYCGLCLSGCPYSIIYSSAHSFTRWIAEGRISYLDGHLVEKVKQADGGAVVHGVKIPENQPFRMEAQRVFLACGVLPTARIVLNSREDLHGPLKLRDSQYFIYPMLRFRSAGDVATERMHTTTQVFMEVEDSKVSRHLVHLQWYGYSTFLRDEIMRTFLRLPLSWKWLRDRFFGRIMIAQGFIHSDESGFVRLSAVRAPDGRLRLLAHPVRSMQSLLVVLALGAKLLRHAWSLGALVLLPGVKIPRPGAGYHSGGTFPMRKDPGLGETDVLGRLSGWPSIHIVDSSVFPSIPATSIVMSSMANARRIADEACRADA